MNVAAIFKMSVKNILLKYLRCKDIILVVIRISINGQQT